MSSREAIVARKQQKATSRATKKAGGSTHATESRVDETQKLPSPRLERIVDDHVSNQEVRDDSALVRCTKRHWAESMGNITTYIQQWGYWRSTRWPAAPTYQPRRWVLISAEGSCFRPIDPPMKRLV